MAQEIVLRLKVDGDVELDQLQKELDQTAQSFNKVQKESAETGNKLKEVGDNGGAIAVLDSLTGGLATRIRDAAEASKVLNFSLKGTRTALIATGIGAFVVALGLVVAYWDDIVDAVTRVNEKLEEQNTLINQNLSALDAELTLLDAKEALLVAEGKTTEGIKKQRLELLNAIREENQALINNLTIQLQRAKAQAKEVTFWEQIVTLSAKVRGLTAAERAADFRGRVTDEELTNIAKLQEQLTAANTKALQLQLTVFGINNPQGGENAGGDGERAGRFKRSALEEVFEVQELQGEIIGIEQAAYFERLQLQNDFALASRRIAAAEAEARIEAAYRVADALGSVSSVLGEATTAGKAAAVAGALINTYLGISNVWSEKSETGLVGAGLIQRIATTAIVAASGFANVKKILSVKVPGGGGGGAANAAGAGGATGTIPAPSFNVVGNTGINQLNDTIANQTDQRVKAYVTMTDIEKGRDIERNSISNATIG